MSETLSTQNVRGREIHEMSICKECCSIWGRLAVHILSFRELLWKPAATSRLLGKPEPEQKKPVLKVILNQLSEFSAVFISIVGEDWAVLRKEQVIPRDGFSPLALFTLLSVDLALLLILSLENL